VKLQFLSAVQSDCLSPLRHSPPAGRGQIEALPRWRRPSQGNAPGPRGSGVEQESSGGGAVHCGSRLWRVQQPAVGGPDWRHGGNIWATWIASWLSNAANRLRLTIGRLESDRGAPPDPTRARGSLPDRRLPAAGAHRHPPRRGIQGANRAGVPRSNAEWI